LLDLIRQRLLIEELTRKRRSDDAQRFAEVFRRSTIDPNPHQIEAAMFALRRLPYGGAMLCDEVGLGKTIEAGLVITQLRAAGNGHILIIVPLSLARQWQVELEDLFSVSSTILGSESIVGAERGIYIVGREFASTVKGRDILKNLGQWDLVVIDEAHELFATIYNRYSKHTGDYQKNVSKGNARRAALIRELISGFPILLLTATPLQNNLYELWGLVQYIDPDFRVLGKFNEFCMLFVTGEGGRSIVPAMEETLRQRLSLILKRTLRRQAQPFMKKPLCARHVFTANFNPDKLEAELYELVSQWLSQEKLAAYKRGHRALMALQLRRRMASSIEALAATLTGIKRRMIQMLETGVYPTKEDISDIDLEDSDDDEEIPEVDFAMLKQDLNIIEQLEKLALRIMRAGAESKKLKLLEIIKRIQQRSLDGVVSDKVVIFTESVKTLNSLVDYLENNGFKDQVTTFSGTNTGTSAERAWKLWSDEVGKFEEKLDSGAAIRAALVYEFKTQTPIFIATEAGAKGLNLQFCNCLINYDLPWNPQRIEQRIGRVHRYGQLHDVVIVNFINLSNQAEQRVYDLLNEKLHVFTEALGVSDTILNTPEIALNLEARINDLLNRCRTQEEIQEAFDRLTLELDAAQKQLHDEKLITTKELLGELDESVRARLGVLETKMQPALSSYDQILLDIIAVDSPVEIISTEAARTLIRWKNKLYHFGSPNPSAECGEPLHIDHEQVKLVFNKCLATTNGELQIESTDGLEGSWEIYKIEITGLEQEQRLIVIGKEPMPGWPSVVPSLSAALEELKEFAELHQRNYVDRLLRQISSRREDLNEFRVGSIAHFTKKLETADKANRLATTMEAIAKAKAQRKKILTEMEKAKQENIVEINRQLQDLGEQERRTRLLQFIDITPRLLFTVKSVSTSRRIRT
jgi:ERCC4-related helicase